jgi:hypothetical protein
VTGVAAPQVAPPQWRRRDLVRALPIRNFRLFWAAKYWSSTSRNMLHRGRPARRVIDDASFWASTGPRTLRYLGRTARSGCTHPPAIDW